MSHRWILFIVLLIGVGAAAAWQQSKSAPGSAVKGAGGTRGLPVATTEVKARDIPLWLSGLGMVQASNTVTVRSRVGGSLDRVNFTEGQNVQAGDVLAQIDPRPYRAILEQVRAWQAQNEAQLAKATRELVRIRALVATDAESRRILERQKSAFAQSTAQRKAIQAAIDAIHIIPGMLYESFIHPLTILSTLPSAGLGALLTLWLFGHDVGVIAIIGILLLIGVVKRNAIMMIDFALAAERTRQLPPEQAIFEARLKRFRPITMTTIAAMLGGIPLTLGQGDGSELRQPLGYAVVGGLFVSQALTLFTTPVVYLYFDHLTQRMRRRRASEAAAVLKTRPT